MPKTARPDRLYRLKNPDSVARVWAYIGDGHPLRGDTHGYTGIAQRVAELLDGRMVYVDQDMLDRAFPDGRTLYEQLKALARRDGRPDIVIGWGTGVFHDRRDIKPTIARICLNESFSFPCNDPFLRDLVPHHLTPDLLSRQGRVFDDRHPGLRRPLIAVFMTETDHDNRDNFYRIIHACKRYTGCTVYFCPSHRTMDSMYDEARETFMQCVADHAMDDRIDMIAPEMDTMWTDYNPYIGLIDRADHAVLLGHSQSILSEAIVNGRPLYLDILDLPPYKYNELLTSGHVIDLRDIEKNGRFNDRKQCPLNITHWAADMVVEAFMKKAAVKPAGAKRLHPEGPAP